MRHGGRILVDQLSIQGVQRIFSVPGESFLAVLDGLCGSSISNIVCRHEGAAAMMAEAHGKLTGTPGVVIVTRAPGACNAAAGVHVAMHDSTPMILLIGQVARARRDREAFQEVDYRRLFSPLAKWVAEVDQTERLPEYLSRAFHVAMSGRPGPVVLALPEDVLRAEAEVPDLPPARPAVAHARASDADTVLALLRVAHRPLVIVGGSIWSARAEADLERFATTWELPVAVTFRRQDHIDNRCPSYVGDLGVGMNPALATRLSDADCLLVIGARLGDVATGGYRLIDPAAPGKTIIHCHPDPGEPGRVYRPDLALAASTESLLATLAVRPAPESRRPWAAWTTAARAAYEAWQVPQETPGAVKLEAIVAHLSALLPENAIITNGAGNYAAFVHRYFCFKRHGTQLAPTSGSMGYAFPAAISAKLEYPDRTVVCFAGDGSFQMTLNEFSTAIQHDAKVIVIVVNNGKYATIRMHQERAYPGRISGTTLVSPDFAALARAYGGHGETVERGEDFAAAFARAMASGSPAVIELRLDDEVMTTSATLSETRTSGRRI